MRGRSTTWLRLNPSKINKRSNTCQLTFYTPAGERRRLSAGRDEAYARRLAVMFDDWLMEGKDPEREMEKLRMSESAQSITVRNFCPIFMKRHGAFKSESIQEAYRYNFQNICRCDSIANAALPDITKRMVMDYMHARMDQDGVKPATVNRDATFLKGMLSRATEWDIIDQNPLAGLKMLPESNMRDVDLTIDQALILINAFPESVGIIVEFALYSGFWLENILGLTIEQFRFHNLTNTADWKPS